ncbi:hypothetical protein RZO55_20090 [Clostridium boliviensis]|uniref:Uncharacterized protein n=1 Tax=Clostridium boliviensis TaxID=318465 RepID=A0ABU4GSA4_9CLOT|nr:hypothetical protein [Clostridium boliviensis]MDW2799875.1 hypothetical protein [Clostridium boliviensis]
MVEENEMLEIVTPMMEHVCDHLCRFPGEISDQEELTRSAEVVRWEIISAIY